MKPAMKWFVLAIVLMGVVRFALAMSGVPDHVVKYFSMTAIMTAGAVYFGITSKTHKERLKAAFLLVMPYMAVEVLALGYTWLTGHATIFHTPEYSFGTSIAQHTIGHLIGGLTWEPLMVFVVIEIVWAVSTAAKSLLKPRPTAV